MEQGLALIFYIIIFISMIFSLVVVFKLYKSEKNYLIAVLSAATALIDLVLILGIIWLDDSVPKDFCIFQGIAIQYCAYLQMMAALCFSIHIYQLLVLKKRKVSQILQKTYIYSIIFVPIIMTVIVSIVSVKKSAIQSFGLSCDIKNPSWVRLIGYPGFNLILTFFGVYFSASAAYKVFRHLDQFKSRITELSTSNADSTVQRNASEIRLSSEVNESNKNGGKLEKSQNLKKSYNLTKAAAVRMVLFSLGYALVNILASIQNVYLVLKGGEDQSKGIRSADFAAASTGIIIYLVFGLPQLIKRFSCRD